MLKALGSERAGNLLISDADVVDELYESLEALLDDYAETSTGFVGSDHPDSVVSKARKALARARGEQS